jgi:hypothetical protein
MFAVPVVCVCALQVKLSHVDWARVLEADMQHAPSMKLAQGYERLHMPGSIQVSTPLPRRCRCKLETQSVVYCWRWRSNVSLAVHHLVLSAQAAWLCVVELLS